MKLRDHPLLRYNLIHQWPPVWVSLDNEDGRLSGREVGVLTEVREPLSRSNGTVLNYEPQGQSLWIYPHFLRPGISQPNI